MSLPNIISALRIPLAALFIIASPVFRLLILFTALATDGLDGYIARRYDMSSKLGAILDPITDKLFVITCLATLYSENLIQPWQIVTFLTRDISVFLFGLILLVNNRWNKWKFQSIWCGKITTVLQFFVLTLIVTNYAVPSTFYLLFILLGLGALVELYILKTLADSEEFKI
jgi:CDP-diacylglycerol--glycerol-3-phosphate 3-phosphatidyltransferase